MANRIPLAAATASNDKKKPSSPNDINFDTFRPAWRIGKFDYQSKWGLHSLLGCFTFSFNDAVLQSVSDLNDEKLFAALDELNGKEFNSVEEFWDKLSGKYSGNIPCEIIKRISLALTQEGFTTKIYPKLLSYESNTWIEILSYTHRRGDGKASNNHNVPVANLCKEARERLDELKYTEDELFSLRLEGKIRLYGFRVHNYLEFLWVDLEHEIYPINH